jgi:gamma-glutamyltranspeptidase
MRANGGFLRRADLEKHTASWVDPVSANDRGSDVYELPPNRHGIAARQMLTILEGFALATRSNHSPDALHTLIEAKTLAFEDRAKFYADPAFDKNLPPGPSLENLRCRAPQTHRGSRREDRRLRPSRPPRRRLPLPLHRRLRGP